jgi:hypothetical protein
MTYDKTTMSGNMMNVYGSEWEDERVYKMVRGYEHATPT